MSNCAPSKLVGIATTLRTAYERAERAADSTIPIAIFGEPGVGKETLVEHVFDGSYVKLSCALLNARIWTDFSASVNGLFEREPEGPTTLYLSEIETLSKASQRRLAFAIRNSALRPRVVLSASERYLALRDSETTAPELDEILRAYPISLPSLRERESELGELARIFLDEACARLGAWPRSLSPKEIERLGKTSFPRNLDDLRRCMEIVATTDALPRELPGASQASIASFDSTAIVKVKAPSRAPSDSDDEGEEFLSLEDAEIRHIELALRRSNGVVEGKSGAAALLKINPYTLRSRMRKMKVNWTKFRVDESDDSR